MLLDGTNIGTFIPDETSYQTFTTNNFQVTPGLHTLTIEGVNFLGGDNTDLVTEVAVSQPNNVSGGDFNTPNVGSGRVPINMVRSAQPGRTPGRLALQATAATFTADNPPATVARRSASSSRPGW